MSDSQVIPEVAVDAAAQALREAFDWGEGDFDNQARLALEAAAQHMMAEAWDAGARGGWGQSNEGWNAVYPDADEGASNVNLNANPYRTTP